MILYEGFIPLLYILLPEAPHCNLLIVTPYLCLSLTLFHFIIGLMCGNFRSHRQLPLLVDINLDALSLDISLVPRPACVDQVVLSFPTFIYKILSCRRFKRPAKGLDCSEKTVKLRGDPD